MRERKDLEAMIGPQESTRIHDALQRGA